MVYVEKNIRYSRYMKKECWIWYWPYVYHLKFSIARKTFVMIRRVSWVSTIFLNI